MLTADLNAVEFIEERSELDERNHVRYAFPLASSEGTASTAAVVFELDPGKRLSRHADSAEELLLVLSGTIEAEVGEERASAGPGGLVVVPARTPHSVTNTGNEVARVVGFFSSATVVAEFDEPAAEGAERIFVIGAPVPLAA